MKFDRSPYIVRDHTKDRGKNNFGWSAKVQNRVVRHGKRLRPIPLPVFASARCQDKSSPAVKSSLKRESSRSLAFLLACFHFTLDSNVTRIAFAICLPRLRWLSDLVSNKRISLKRQFIIRIAGDNVIPFGKTMVKLFGFLVARFDFGSLVFVGF